MITGAHIIIYSKNAEADRIFLRDILKFPHVDVGGNWLIFALPPSEVAMHPASDNNRHEFFLMTDDVKSLRKTLLEKGVKCSPIKEQIWGHLIKLNLPGGGKLGVFQPKYQRP